MTKREKAKKLSRRAVALLVAGIIIAVLGLTVLGLYIGYWAVDAGTRVWTPSYAMLSESEISAIYGKETLSDGDYETLFAQTGLTRVGIDRARREPSGLKRILDVQKSYFTPRGVRSEAFAPLVCTDYLDGEPATAGYFERGDIIVSSTTHFSGFRMGHAAIITSKSGYLYQSNQVGVKNGYAYFSDMYAVRADFMVFRVKPEYFSASGEEDGEYRDNLDRATSFIETAFGDVPYNIATGVFTKKNSMSGTTCAHMLWYGFLHFDDANGGTYNLDLDSNGRLLVLPKDISRSPYLELVQIFGFDPAVLYP